MNAILGFYNQPRTSVDVGTGAYGTTASIAPNVYVGAYAIRPVGYDAARGVCDTPLRAEAPSLFSDLASLTAKLSSVSDSMFDAFSRGVHAFTSNVSALTSALSTIASNMTVTDFIQAGALSMMGCAPVEGEGTPTPDLPASPTPMTMYYEDKDQDSFGNSNVSRPYSALTCGSSSGCSLGGIAYTQNSKDCDDSNKDISPAVTEICDGIDQNCNGNVDEGVAYTYYVDNDGDGFGDPNQPISTCADTPPLGYAKWTNDCDDTNPDVYPNETVLDICDGIDSDCDGAVDEDGPRTYYYDGDKDGYGVDSKTTTACEVPTGYAAKNNDCDDNNPKTNPGASECKDGIDNNCDGTIDGAYADPCN